MSVLTVTTQTQLESALADTDVTTIYIESTDGVWLHIGDHTNKHVVAWDSSHVVAWGSSHVEAWGSSHVVARGSSHVEARGSSHVVARGSSHVEAWDSSHVVARDSSHVEAWDSSHVVAWDSSHVEARGSSHVEAWGSSHVEARGSSHVEAWGSSHVEAGSFVAVHLHSGRAAVSGGVLIDLTSIDESQPATWCNYRGAALDGDDVVLFKAVRDDLRSARGFAYPVGETVECDDFADADRCGGGLHLSPTVSQAFSYDTEATRFLECRVPLAELRPITGGTSKAKARRVRVVREVDRHGKPLTVETVQA